MVLMSLHKTKPMIHGRYEEYYCGEDRTAAGNTGKVRLRFRSAMTDHCTKQNLSATTLSKARVGTDANRTNKDVKTRNTTRKQTASPPKPNHGILDARGMRASPALAAYTKATGGPTESHLESIIEMTDYLDVNGGWTAIGYNPEALPGYTPGCSIQLLQSRLDVLPQATNANNATNNVVVLAGVLMDGAGLGTGPALLSNKQTFIAPAVDPTWKHVMSADLRSLNGKGYQSIYVQGTSEVARLALIAPDSGAVSTATTLQARLILRYAISQPLSVGARILVAAGLQVDDASTGAPSDIVVFPRYTGSQNGV